VASHAGRSSARRYSRDHGSEPSGADGRRARLRADGALFPLCRASPATGCGPPSTCSSRRSRSATEIPRARVFDWIVPEGEPRDATSPRPDRTRVVDYQDSTFRRLHSSRARCPQQLRTAAHVPTVDSYRTSATAHLGLLPLTPPAARLARDYKGDRFNPRAPPLPPSTGSRAGAGVCLRPMPTPSLANDTGSPSRRCSRGA
jgi:hypothetical protein